MKGKFIVIEGLDGAGKSTAAERLTGVLEKEFGIKVCQTYEPNNPSCAGKYIREVLEKKITNFSPRTLALAFAANRLDHGDRIIKPWLSNGADHLVLCDRYYLSSLVYQSSENFPKIAVMQLNELAIRPDLIFFLNVSNEVCYERMKKRNQPPELFESNLIQTRNKYYQAIAFLREARKETIVEIDGNGTVEETVDAMLGVLKPMLTQ